MTKRKRIIKRIIICVVCFIVLLCCVALCGYLTRSRPAEYEGSMQFIYLEVDCGRGDTFFLGKDNTSHTKDLEYNYGEDYLTIKAKAYYADGRYCSTQTFTSFGQNAIPLSEAGVYKLEQRYKDPQGGPDIVFNLNVTEKKDGICARHRL